MTGYRLAAAAAIVATIAPGTALSQPASGPATEIQALERAMADAMHAKDRARLDGLLAPDYVLRAAPDIDRSTWLQNAVTLCWGERSDIDDFEARAHDAVVIASFQLTFYVDPATCGPAVLRSLITDVWTRQADGWRLQVRHSGPPPNAGIAAQYGAVPEVPPAWEFGGELSLIATGGNTSTRTFGVGSTMLHRAAAGNTRAAFAFLNSEADGVANARSLTAQARHGFRVNERLELFGEAAYGRDRFAGIGDRVAVAGGLALTSTLARRHVLRSEGSLGFTREDRLDATRLRFATATGALNYRWTLSPGATLTQDLAVTSDLGTPDNWRGASATAVSVTLTRRLSLKASHALEYRNQPVASFKRTDMRTAAALVVSLQRR